MGGKHTKFDELKIKSEQDKQNERDNDFPCDQLIDPLHFVQSSFG